MNREMKFEMRELPVADLIPTPDNPRKLDRKSERFLELKASIAGGGVRCPVAVRPHPTETGKWDLRYGQRRHAACEELGLATMPCLVYLDLADEEAYDLTLEENLHRDDLTPIEQGRAVAIALEHCGGDRKAVAARMGVTERWVALRARLQELSLAWQKAITDPKHKARSLSVGHLVALAKYPAELQDGILNAQRDYLYEWSLPAWEKMLASSCERKLSGARWKLDDETLVPEAGACATCPHRASLQGVLFADDEAKLKRNDRCLNPSCWEEKEKAALKRRLAEATAAEGSVVVVAGDAGYSEQELAAAVLGVQPKQAYIFEPCKKSAPGAIATFIATGPKAGTVEWAKPRKGWEDEAKGSRVGDDGKRLPTSLAERRKRLKRRRDALAIQRVAELLTKAGPPEHLLELLAAFGTRHGEQDQRDMSAWKAFDAAVESGANAECWSKLWAKVADLLGFRLQIASDSGSFIPILEVERVAMLIGADMKAIVAAVERDLPEPRSWASLNADGTPKKHSEAPEAKPKRKKAGSE